MSAVPNPTNELLQAAVAYAQRGWYVMPLYPMDAAGRCTCRDGFECTDAGKHPRWTAWTTPGKGCTNDPDAVTDHWTKHPADGIGIVAGPSSLAFVDMDADTAVAELKRRTGLQSIPKTFTTTTGKGHHLYYNAPSGVTLAPNVDKAAGFDLRAGPSYVVAPPSPHATGAIYKVSRNIPVADLPPELVAYYQQKTTTRPALTDVSRIPSGQRNDYLTSLAGSMRRKGFDQQSIQAAIRVTNTLRCDPPIDQREVDRIARSVARYPPSDVTTLIRFEVSGADALEHATNESSWRPAALPLHAEPITPSISNLFFPGLCHELTGHSEAGKTMLLAAVAIEHARAGHHVAWIDFEMGPRLMMQRLRDGLQMRDDEVDQLVNDPETSRFHYIRPETPAATPDIHHLLSLKPTLVCYDAMTGALDIEGLSSNSDTDIDKAHRIYTTPFKDQGAAVVWIDHPGKDAEKGTKGSIRKQQAVDVRYVVEVHREYRKGEGGASRLKVKKDRTADLDRSMLRVFTLDPIVGWTVTVKAGDSQDESGHFRPTTLMRRVSEFLDRNGPSTQRLVIQSVPGNQAGKISAIDALIREGFCIDQKVTKNGGQGRLITPVKLFEEGF